VRFIETICIRPWCRPAWGFGHTGAQGVAAYAPDLIAPGVFFGKGFGDLPDSLAWLRPFGITGAVSVAHPLAGGNSTNIGLDSETGQLGPLLTRNVDLWHWGLQSNSARFTSQIASPQASSRKMSRSSSLYHSSSLHLTRRREARHSPS
jgi:hypothetical protein